MFSGGVGSWMTARRVVDMHGTDGLVLLFADTMMEDEDLYRFIVDAAKNIGGEFVRIADGRTPWQVFTDERFLGNTKVDPCSKILKRQLLDKWRDAMRSMTLKAFREELQAGGTQCDLFDWGGCGCGVE